MARDCPLDMHVRQRAGGTLMSTDAEGRRVETFAARLKLELKDLRPDRTGQRMISATVTVLGWNPTARAVPLDSSGGRTGNISARVWLAPSLHHVMVKARLWTERATVEALLDSIRVDETLAQR